MLYLGWILIFSVITRLMIAFINWVSRPHLPKVAELTNHPFISILIPARNEEKNISNLLSDLIKFNHKPLEITVYNDNSTDNTAAIVAEFVQKHNFIRLINGNVLPDGWLGKNHSCHNLALQAQGDYILFLDADVRVNNGILEKAIHYIEKNDLKLLSIFPTQIMNSKDAKIVVPLMNWILLSLLPLHLVRTSKKVSFSAANGQFLMFNAKTYKKIQPHQHLKKSRVEDIETIKLFKSKELKVATLLGDYDISCNMYNSYTEAINGFSKNVFHFFGGNKFLTVLFATTISFAPIYLLIFNGLTESIIYLLSAIFIKIFTTLASKQSVYQNIKYIGLQQIAFWQIIFKAFQNHKTKQMIWKDRNVF